MPKKKGEGGKGKKPALWRELGFYAEKTASGKDIKGYWTGGAKGKGDYISERQYRKEYTHAPVKGSPGHKERQAAKKLGKEFRPIPKKTLLQQMQEFAKKPGATAKWFDTGKPPEPDAIERAVTEKHNEFVDRNRLEAIQFKQAMGVIDKKEAAQLKRDLKRAQRLRDRLLELNDKRKTDLSREERKALEIEYRKLAGQHRKAQDKLATKGIIPTDNEALRWDYYHS